MSRVQEHLNFALSFSGLGYIALWPLSTPDARGQLFGAALLCGDDGGVALLDAVCRLPHPLLMPTSLHLLGVAAVVYVVARSALLLTRVRRARREERTHSFIDAAHVAARLRMAVPVFAARSRPLRPRRNVPPARPRTEFGLRGLRL